MRMESLCLMPEMHGDETSCHELPCAICASRQRHRINNTLSNSTNSRKTSNDSQLPSNNNSLSLIDTAKQKSILSASPFIVYTSPILERQQHKDICTLLPYFKQPIYPYGKEATKVLQERSRGGSMMALAEGNAHISYCYAFKNTCTFSDTFAQIRVASQSTRSAHCRRLYRRTSDTDCLQQRRKSGHCRIQSLRRESLSRQALGPNSQGAKSRAGDRVRLIFEGSRDPDLMTDS